MIIQNEIGSFEVACGREIVEGDMYLAKRNTGWKLLECREHNKKTGVVFPRTNDYCFDSHECLKVIDWA